MFQRLHFSSAFLAAALTLLCLLRPQLAHAAPPLRLHAQGKDIVDTRGKVVTLRGINLGGWLVEEPWMMPFQTTPPPGSSLPPIRDNASLWAVIGKRFGPAGKARAQAAFRAAWLNESDFDRIKAAGLNCVRLPFLASQIEQPGGFAPLDQAVAWASARGLYVILDMHGAPGSQSDQDHTGVAGRTEFFKYPANVAQGAADWTRIARRYKDSPTVAGYDLINEPMAAPNSDTLYIVEDRLYRAVRAADPTHLVFIEDGYTGMQWMPFPGPCGWTDVVYSSHTYDFGAKSASDQANAFGGYLKSVIKERDRHQVPFYVGEFSFEPNGTPETEAAMIHKMDTSGLSWSAWTYKVIFGGSGGLTLWSLIGNDKPVTPLDPYRDTEAEFVRKCTQVRSENLARNDARLPGLRGVP